MTLAYRSSPLQSSLWEWHRPPLWPPDLFAVVLFAAAAALLWNFRKVRLSDWILFAAFAAASLLAVRNTILMAWLGPVLIASYVPLARATPRWAEFAAAALALVAAAAEIFSGNAFQLRADEWLYPQGAADFLLAHHIDGPMFNTYEHGGYLMWRLWPRQKVFIDGRALSDSLFHDYQRILYALPADAEKSGLELLDAYGIQTIVVNGFEYGSGAVYLLPVALSALAADRMETGLPGRPGHGLPAPPAAGRDAARFRRALAGLEAECAAHMARIPGAAVRPLPRRSFHARRTTRPRPPLGGDLPATGRRRALIWSAMPEVPWTRWRRSDRRY